MIASISFTLVLRFLEVFTTDPNVEAERVSEVHKLQLSAASLALLTVLLELSLGVGLNAGDL